MDNNNQHDNELYFNRVVTTSLRIGFVALIFFLSYIILKPFIMLVVWSIIMAIGIYPLFLKFSKQLGNKDKLASTIIILIALALIVIPSVLMLSSTIDNIQELKDSYTAGTLVIPPPPEDVAEWPIVGKPIYEAWHLTSINLEKALETFKPQLQEFLPKLLDSIAGLGGIVLLTIISIIIVGVLLLQAEPAKRTTIKIFRLLIGKDAEGITDLVNLTIRSVVQGILGIAIIQSIGCSGNINACLWYPRSRLMGADCYVSCYCPTSSYYYTPSNCYIWF